MKYLVALVLLFHGLIHLMGFAKAFELAPVEQLKAFYSRPMGLAWLVITVLMVCAAFFIVAERSYWWMLAGIAVLLSQALVIIFWSDARFGTIANALLLPVLLGAMFQWQFERQFQQDADSLALPAASSLLMEADLASLPLPVQRYIRQSGVVGKEIPRAFAITLEGRIRADQRSPWIPFVSEQVNTIREPARLFFMKARMKGLPVAGYHHFRGGKAVMDVRLLSLISVQFAEGPEMDTSELVTWFNDLCLFAPGALTDPRIQWSTVDSLSAQATFSWLDKKIQAVLHFNPAGELTNFISEDRYRLVSGEKPKRLLFLTPVSRYQQWKEGRLPGYGEAQWRLPAGDMVYGQFTTQQVTYLTTNDWPLF